MRLNNQLRKKIIGYIAFIYRILKDYRNLDLEKYIQFDNGFFSLQLREKELEKGNIAFKIDFYIKIEGERWL